MTETPASRDLALLVRWRDGDRDAGTALLSHYKRTFHRLCLRLGVTDEDSIVDVFQDVVLVALRELPTLPERISRSFAGWFLWQVRDAVGRRRRRRFRPLDADPLAQDPLPSERAALWEGIQRCWNKLPSAEHRVFELRFLGGMTLAEVATETGTNVNAVGQAIFRLSRKLRTCLAKSGFGSTDGEGDIP